MKPHTPPSLPFLNQLGLIAQNSPNPFNSETEIRYYVPSKASQALLLVTDAQGRVVLSRLASTGAGSWRIAAKTLQVGV